MRPLKNLIKRALRAFGYDIAPYPPKDSLAKHLRVLFSSLDINCVLDVGANEGQYGLFLRELGYKGHIVSFEPASGPYALLEGRRAKDPLWSAHRVALGSAEAVAAINVMPASTGTSFLSPNRYAEEQFGDMARVREREDVRVRRLDAVFQECLAHIARPLRIYLKIDTQGYDLEVLRGASAVLGQVLAMQSEVSVVPIYEGMTGYLDSIKSMNGLGFELTGLFPVWYDKDGLRVLEFDCVMRKSDRGRTT